MQVIKMNEPSTTTAASFCFQDNSYGQVQIVGSATTNAAQHSSKKFVFNNKIGSDSNKIKGNHSNLINKIVNQTGKSSRSNSIYSECKTDKLATQRVTN